MSADQFPAPLVTADVDLRDFPFMPLDIGRLFGSEFHARSSDAEWRAGVTLWLKSYHQVPAGSLPDDDVALARLAEFGRDVKGWRKVRAGALYGWVKCSDGRWYHPVVCEKAADAWERKTKHRERSRKGNEARWGSRADGGASGTGGGTEPAPGAGHPGADAEGGKGSPSGLGADGESVLDGVHQASLKDASAIPQGVPKPSLSCPKGQGQGQGEDKTATTELTAAQKAARRFEELWRQFWPNDPGFPAPTMTLETQAAGWLQQGATAEIFDQVLGRAFADKARRGEGPPTDFGCVKRSLPDAIARARAQAANGDAAPTQRLPDGTVPIAIQPSAEELWRIRLTSWNNTGRKVWPQAWGEKIGHPRCEVPAAILAEFGLSPGSETHDAA